MDETDLMSSSCCCVGVNVVETEVVGAVGFADVEEVGAVVVVEGAGVDCDFVGVEDLESELSSESESESQVRSSLVDCAAPVLRFVSNFCHIHTLTFWDM